MRLPEPLRRPALQSILLWLGVLLAWSISPLMGGQAHVVPLFFIAPILWAATRHTPRTAMGVAIVSSVLAGPLTPADVATGEAQPLETWLIRAGLFLCVGAIVAREVGRVRTGAQRDPLTGLPNRAALEPCLDTALARAERRGQGLGLVYIDLDDFKLVNDGLGHASGDELLRKVAARLEAVKRAGDVVVRHGGDEFIVLLDELGEIEDRDALQANAAAAVERFVQALETPFTVAGCDVRVGASAGLCLYPDDSADADTLHRRADAAMYAAKSSGSRWSRYVPSARDPLARLSRAARLRNAITEGGLEVHYQPIFRVDGGVMGVEALVRWCDGDAGPVSPADFIGLAEETGLIEPLGDWVLDGVCRQAAAWHAEGLCPHVGVNVAPRQFRQPGFAEKTIAKVRGHGLDPHRFVIEITESAWAVETDALLPSLNALRAAGFKLAIDDFGAGHSSFSRLEELPVDVIKIDRAFLRGVPQSARSVAIMDAIFRLAAACGSDVVAEGVETDAQRAFLLASGCLLAQGYALGRPGRASEISEVLRESLEPSRRHRRAPGPAPGPLLTR